jgi:putative lipoprotein
MIMKLEKLFFATVLSGLAFTACVDNDDKSEWNDGSQPISFTSSIKGVNTRAVDSKWTAGDKIGVFMKATSGDLASAIAVNKQHATDANGNVSAVDADNALYYPTDGSSVDFIAYYPYTASLTGNVYKVNVADQSKPENIDLLYSNNATGFAKGTANKPQLQFAHQLSQIVFNITKDATVPSLNGLTVTFEGMNTTADFALANGALSNVGAAAKIAAVVDETAATAKTIVLPAAALADVKVVFNLNGKTFTADYPQKELLTGRKYTHNVKLSDSNGQPVIVMDAATIEDWITVPGGDIDVDFGDGTDVPEPSEVVVLDESFNAGQGAFTIDNKDLGGMNFVWAHKVFESVGYMKASGYYNNTANACESWLVSPNVDLSKATKATLTFMHCDNNSKVDLAARQTVMTLWATEVATEQWEQIAIPTYGAGTDYVYVSSGDIDLSKYAGKSMKFAFKYVCNGDFSATWQIQNVKVVADAGEGGGTVDPDPEPDPTPGEEVILYEETLGTPAKVGNNWPYADAYTGYTDTHNMTLSSYSTSIRSVDDIANIWFPKTKPSCYFQVSGFDTSNYTNLKFTFEIAGENSTDNQDLIAVETDKGTVTVPSATVEKSPNYHPVALTLQDGMTWLKISNDNSTASFRIAKLKVVGTTK